ncbi:putative wall-associated receptor kinase-like 11 isoform X2 [Pistacia vera]|uniref:putative wall-associated receptor kinase-like 11 isoform X2 n=1 Tax=Pistacia vera TaxID=55513 RepID=UPI00126379BE|nr:putative wall-associated receptor kinase-like 11 isoform X2 [Pistacia vera]
MCYPAPPKGPGKNKDIPIGLCSAFGTLSLSMGARRLYEFVKRKAANKLNQKNFKKNGGLLLQQRMSSNDGNIQKLKFFTENELEKATDSYNETRILGQGGQGTVYKGMLEEGRLIAVKRLKKVAERVDVFINEYIHEQNEEFPLTWDLRLRIAIEVADALSYLHSIRIYHGNIKSSNILLDEKYRAKVSDVGTSRSIPVDQTHLIENYPDPEYFRSSQFTEKSDVYSFGLVLAELLTGQKPVRSTNLEEEDKSLALYFLQIMKENRLFEIVDAQVLKDGKEEEIIVFANLTERCLKLNGRKRPTMREVTTKLAGIRISIGASILKQNCEEGDYVDGDINSQLKASSSFTGSFFE